MNWIWMIKMKIKLIIIVPTDDKKEIENFCKMLNGHEEVVIPDHSKILIKDKDGYWRELK